MGTNDFENARYTLGDLPESGSAESANFSLPKDKRDLFTPWIHISSHVPTQTHFKSLMHSDKPDLQALRTLRQEQENMPR